MDIEIFQEEYEASQTLSDNETMVDLYTTHPVKSILIATFVPVFIISLTGNLLVIFVIVRNRSMHTVTNFFLLNLAISDLLVTLCCIIPTLLWFIQSSWTLGSFICKTHKATITMTANASVFMLTVISMERFIAILYPFQTKRILTVQRLIGVVVIIWFLSIVLSIPIFVVFDLVPHIGDEYYCGAPHDFLENGAKIQGIFMIFFTYLTPLLIMMVLYTKISQGLWARSRTGSSPLGAIPSQGGSKNKANLRVTYKGSKTVTSVEEKSSVPPEEGLRIHIGPQISPPPRESTVTYSDSEDTPHRKLLRNSSSGGGAEPQKSSGEVPEMIGPFFVDEPDEAEDVQPEKEESKDATTVLWKSCNDILLCSDGEASIPASQRDTCAIETEQDGVDSNGIDAHRELSKSENVLSACDTSEPNQPTDGHLKVPLDTDKEMGNNLSPRRSFGGVKSRLNSKSESDKRPVHRKYEPAASGVQASPAPYARSNANSTSRQCMKKSSSKRKRNAEAVMQARRKVIRLLVVMVVCFALSLFPLQLMFVWTLFAGFSDQTIPGALVPAFTYLAYFTNSAINPFLYAFLSDNFRSKMRETLYCGSSRTRRQVSLRQIRLKSTTSDAYTESELMPS